LWRYSSWRFGTADHGITTALQIMAGLQLASLHCSATIAGEFFIFIFYSTESSTASSVCERERKKKKARKKEL
jgi:hypothetical protein